jgi:cephalosporin hydroxylase
MGRPVIQLPEDLLRIQELIYRVRPDVVIETGVAHGGSLVFYASLLRALGTGRVIGVDVDIRPHNRLGIERHELSSLITLLQGNSAAPEVVDLVRGHIGRDERVLVILDSNHTTAHVGAELCAYAPMVTTGSYMVATDGIMAQLSDVPRGRPEWGTDNPTAAVREFLAHNSDFLLEEPTFVFNETLSSVQITHWPCAYLRRMNTISPPIGRR